MLVVCRLLSVVEQEIYNRILYFITAEAQRTQRFKYFQKKCSFILYRFFCSPFLLEDQRKRIRKKSLRPLRLCGELLQKETFEL